jgi:hypothetical protein
MSYYNALKAPNYLPLFADTTFYRPMTCYRMSCGCGNLWLIASVPPPASGLHLRDDASLCAHLSLRVEVGVGHLRLPAKQNTTDISSV